MEGRATVVSKVPKARKPTLCVCDLYLRKDDVSPTALLVFFAREKRIFSAFARRKQGGRDWIKSWFSESELQKEGLSPYTAAAEEKCIGNGKEKSRLREKRYVSQQQRIHHGEYVLVHDEIAIVAYITPMIRIGISTFSYAQQSVSCPQRHVREE